jgi:carboxymethylenebutenolidase
MNDLTLTVSDGTTMGVYVARPAKPAGLGLSAMPAQAGIIVFQEAFGVNDYIRRMADRFAGAGDRALSEEVTRPAGRGRYLAIAPELFHRTAPGFEADYEERKGVAEAMGALTVEGQIADAKAAYDWLVSEGVPKDKIVAIGFCMGGRAAYLANSALPLAASVSFYGGGINALLDRASSLHGPQLLIWGGADAHILPEHRRAVAEALTAAEKPFVEAVWSKAPHGFACDARSSYHAPSAREALALADAFLAENLL